MKTSAILLLCAMSCLAQPAKMKVLLFEYSSNELASVFFWIESKTDATNAWGTIAVVDLASGTNAYTFYRVGVAWRKNAPDWMTNFQFVELPPAPPKAKALTAGIKTGKLPTVKLPPKTYRAVTPPMPPK